MGARIRKSKKRSAASSKPPPESFVFFIERNLGRRVVAEALRQAGETVEVHDDHLVPDSPDEAWIRLCGRRGWLAITRDKNIRYREWEKQQIVDSRARVFVLRGKALTGNDMAEIILRARARMKRFAARTSPPFVASIRRSGEVVAYEL